MKEPGPGDADIGRMLRLFAGSIIREEVHEALGQLVEDKFREYLGDDRLPPKGSGKGSAKKEAPALPKLYTREEVRLILRCSMRTVVRLIQANKLRPTGPGRNLFTPFEIERYLSQAADRGVNTGSEDALLADLDDRMDRVK